MFGTCDMCEHDLDEQDPVVVGRMDVAQIHVPDGHATNDVLLQRLGDHGDHLLPFAVALQGKRKTDGPLLFLGRNLQAAQVRAHLRRRGCATRKRGLGIHFGHDERWGERRMACTGDGVNEAFMLG